MVFIKQQLPYGDVFQEHFHLNFFISLFSLYIFIKHDSYSKLLKKEITYPHRCSPVNLLHNCGIPFYKNTFEGLLKT